MPSLAVINAEAATLEGGKLILTGVAANSIVFADRPVRAAGHVTTAQFIMQWDEGKDNFAIDPPNATVSVIGGDGSQISDVVVTLLTPVLEGRHLTFDVAVLEGSLNGATGPAAVFIDHFARRLPRQLRPRRRCRLRRMTLRRARPRRPEYHRTRATGTWLRPHNAYHGAVVRRRSSLGRGRFCRGRGGGGRGGVHAAANAYPYCGYPPYPPCN